MGKGADPNAHATGEYYDGRTALMVACKKGNEGLELVKYLVANGADPKDQDEHGNTALSIARSKRAEKLIAFLEGS